MRGSRVIALLLAAIVSPGCSNAPITGATVAHNGALIRQLDSVKFQVAGGQHEVEVLRIIQMLAMGSAVQQVTISVDSVPREFEATGMLWVDTDGRGNPVDSVYLLEAWRGTRADTLVLLQYWMYPVRLPQTQIWPPALLAEAAYFAGPGVWIAQVDSTTTSYEQLALGGECYLHKLPYYVALEPGPGCENQRVWVSYDAIEAPGDTLSSGVHRVSLPAVSISGVRMTVPPQLVLVPDFRVHEMPPRRPF